MSLKRMHPSYDAISLGEEPGQRLDALRDVAAAVDVGELRMHGLELGAVGA